MEQIDAMPTSWRHIVIMLIRKILSFVRKDAIINMSYKPAFFMSIIGIVASSLTFFYISRLFKKPDYFPFVLIGIAFTSYLNTALRTFSGRIREAQVTGVLEAMLVTPARTKEILAGMGGWGFLFTSFRVLVYILLGVLFFGVNLSNANIPAALLILFLSIICFSSFGIGAAGLILIFRRSEHLTWVIGAFTGLVSGTYFPIKILPIWIKMFSYIMPLTYSLRGIRGALLHGKSILELTTEILLLCIFIIILFPLSIKIFKKAVRKTKIDGSLVHH